MWANLFYVPTALQWFGVEVALGNMQWEIPLPAHSPGWFVLSLLCTAWRGLVNPKSDTEAGGLVGSCGVRAGALSESRGQLLVPSRSREVPGCDVGGGWVLGRRQRAHPRGQQPNQSDKQKKSSAPAGMQGNSLD